MKIFYHWRRITHPQSSLLFETAYHEAGHTCFSYLSKFKVKNVSINLQRVGNGLTSPNYLELANVVNVLFNISSNTLSFNNLSNSEKKSIQSVMLRLTHSLLAGPIAEARFKSLRDNQANAEVIVEHSDYRMCLEILTGLNSLFKQYNMTTIPISFLESEVNRVNDIMILDDLWIPIQEVAVAILNKKSASLQQDEIESILQRTGFLSFIDKQWE